MSSHREASLDIGGNNCLHIAARLGYEELVERIIDSEHSLLIRPNKKGENPLHVAARAGHLPIVKILTDQSFRQFQQSSEGCWIWRTPNDEGNTALHVALLSKHEEVALHLLDLESEIVLDVNANGAGPLYLAARAGFVRVLIKILLAGGGENIAGPSGWTPLHASVFARCTENIEVLHEWIPELTKKQDSMGKTALHHAITQHNSFEIVRLLLELDASSANIPDNDGQSPLSVAAREGNSQAVRTIQKACPNMNPPSVICYPCRKFWHAFQQKLRVALLPYDPREQAKNFKVIDLKANMNAFLVVAGLIVTLTFAAAFTMPGGYNQDNGSPLLLHQPALKVFLISNAIAFFCSVMAVASSALSAKKGEDMSLTRYTRVLGLLGHALRAAVVAFISGLYAVISVESRRLAILICVIGCCIRFLGLGSTVMRLLANRIVESPEEKIRRLQEEKH